MAQAGYTPISLYFSSTAAAVPTSGNLANGELALNIADMKLYAKNSAGTVTLLASSGGATGTVSSVAVSGGTTGLTTSGGPITTSGTITLAGTLATTNGGTGLTSFTSGGVVYASSTSALATGSALVFDGANLGVGVTPSAWSGITALQVKNASMYGSGNEGGIYANAYYNAGWKYIATATATAYDSNALAGGHRWYTAPSGTAGNAITFTQAMTLDASGNLLVGATSGGGLNERLNVTGNGILVQSAASTNRGLFGNFGGANLIVGSFDSIPVEIRTNNVARFLVGTAGQLGIGGATYGTAGQVLTSGGSGAAPTWASAGGGSGFSAKTANYTAVSGDNILANTSAGSWTLTLPASPSTGNSVQVMDSIGTFGQYPLTVARNGQTIMSAAEDMTMAVNGAATTFVYNGSTWRVI